MPREAKINKNFFFVFPASAIAPSIGALIAINKPIREFIEPITNVLSAASKSPAQKDLKKIGKKPAMTVVANPELAQS